MVKYYAHSNNGDDSKKIWQTMEEHAIAVGEGAAHRAKIFGGEKLAEIEGLLHDVGKYCTEFQQRLGGAKHRVDHSTWGAKIASEMYGPWGMLMAYAIAGHHTGLMNGKETDSDDTTISPLDSRLNKPDLPTLDECWKEELQLITPSELNEYYGDFFEKGFELSEDRATFQMSFFGRMVFSCLVDADFIDTENYYRELGKIPKRSDINQYDHLVTLRKKLTNAMSAFTQDTEINKIRNDIFLEVVGKAEEDQGFFSLNVPTGGGKTLTSLAFALDHAIEHGMDRVILAIPFTSIVEQNAAVYKDILGEENVLEHHSTFDHYERIQSDNVRDKMLMAQQNWDAPIVVTTAVQFFESLYANKTSRCRKLHNIANSVVILDEVQTLPTKQLLPCVYAIDELVRNYNTSVVLCTATQPAIEKNADFLDGLENVRPLIEDPIKLHEKLKRVEVEHVGLLEDDELVERLIENNQVLCIVNSRRHGRFLYEQIRDRGYECKHLTTSMHSKHRTLALDEIREDLDEGRECILIATSLIEAGVDIDFPTVYRAEAGLDSIAQAVGRCNRHGSRGVEDSRVYVFQSSDEWPTPPDLLQFVSAARNVLFRHEKPIEPEAIEDYFKQLYWQIGRDGLGFDFLQNINNCRVENIPYEDMANQVKLITSTMIPIIIPCYYGDDNDGEVRKLIERLKYVEFVGSIARKLQLYSVQIPERAFKKLLDYGFVEYIESEKYGEQFIVLTNESLYDVDSGLNWEDPTFIQSEECVF